MYFDFDLSLNILTLFYTEVVLLDPFMTNSFSLHSSTVVSNRFNFQFTQPNSVLYLDSNRSTITLKMFIDDLYIIQNLTLLATSSQNTFLSQNRGAVVDTAENEVLSITPLQPLQVIIMYFTTVQFRKPGHTLKDQRHTRGVTTIEAEEANASLLIWGVASPSREMPQIADATVFCQLSNVPFFRKCTVSGFTLYTVGIHFLEHTLCVSKLSPLIGFEPTAIHSATSAAFPSDLPMR